MAIRFAPFARVRVLSLASELLKVSDGPVAVLDLLGNINNTITRLLNLDPSEVFTDIGLATELSITENFNTRPQYGIGEPANPIMVPGNMSIRVTMSRLTTDSRQMADYITKPSFYYSSVMQRVSALFGSNSVINDLDFLFYTYLHVGSIEIANNTVERDMVDTFQNFEVIAFMPSTFTKRLSSQNAEVITDVEGEGKLYKLSTVMTQVDDLLRGLTETAETLQQSSLPDTETITSA